MLPRSMPLPHYPCLQPLTEAPAPLDESNVNRLEDSFVLWKAICSSPQLSQTALILFMNKCNLLEKKIKSGVIVKKSLSSFWDRPNDSASVTKFDS